MSPLVLRPANGLDTPKRLTNANGNGDASESVLANSHVLMDEDQGVNHEILHDQMRQYQVERAVRLKAKNRRKRYLELHPEYFSDPSLELADPLLYDRLIRRFQTASEREAEGQRKGFSGEMATDLWRAEAKRDALTQPDPNSLFTYNRGPHGQIIEEDKDEVPMTKEEGRKWWIDEMTQRFLRGGDDDFEYAKVENYAYDDPEEERDLQEKWFESMDSDFDSDGEGKEKVLHCETGIQDY